MIWGGVDGGENPQKGLKKRGVMKAESFDFGFGIVDCGMLNQKAEKRAHSVMEEWETEVLKVYGKIVNIEDERPTSNV